MSTLQRIICRLHVAKISASPVTKCISAIRFSSTELPKIENIDSRDHWVVGADEGRTIVLFHPERPFPYEHSLPIPRQESILKEEESVLKLNVRKAVLDAESAKDKKPVSLQLEKMLHKPSKYFDTSKRYTVKRFRDHKIAKIYPRAKPTRDGL